jgi:hypothetical protein
MLFCATVPDNTGHKDAATQTDVAFLRDKLPAMPPPRDNVVGNLSSELELAPTFGSFGQRLGS